MYRPRIKVFNYISELDCFLPTEEYSIIAEQLGLVEWNPVVWIGRLFLRDNDYGEHWFDSWDARDVLEGRARELGYNAEQLLIIVPQFFQDGQDGPSHSDEQRKRFWTDVLQSLHLSLDTLFEEARDNQQQLKNMKKEGVEEEFIPNLEGRIKKIRAHYMLH